MQNTEMQNTEKLSFTDGEKYIKACLEKIREMYVHGEISFSKGVELLDKESVHFGAYEPYYFQNRWNIIKTLFFC